MGKKDLNRHLKEGGKKHMKRYWTSYVITKFQIKTTMSYHYTPITMAMIQNTDNKAGNRNSHLLLVEVWNGIATLKDSSAISNKIIHTLNIWASNHACWYLPKGAENLCLHRNLHINVARSRNTKQCVHWPLLCKICIHVVKVSNT